MRSIRHDRPPARSIAAWVASLTCHGRSIEPLIPAPTKSRKRWEPWRWPGAGNLASGSPQDAHRRRGKTWTPTPDRHRRLSADATSKSATTTASEMKWTPPHDRARSEHGSPSARRRTTAAAPATVKGRQARKALTGPLAFSLARTRKSWRHVPPSAATAATADRTQGSS